MRVRFRKSRLERLETDPRFTDGHSAALVKAYRKKMNFIRQTIDERELYALRSLGFEKLKGARAHQRSIRLNDQWRLILEIEGEGDSKTIVIVSIEDYH